MIIFLTMHQVILIGRTATWDIYSHAFMMGAVCFLVRGFAADAPLSMPMASSSWSLYGTTFLVKTESVFSR